MLRDRTRLILVCLALIASAVSASAQVSANSPYSRFGLGDLNSPSFVHMQSLGNLTAAYSDDFQSNIANPATLARLKATAFETGFDASRSFLKSGNEEASFWGGTMNYLSLSFPILNPLNRVLDRKSLDFNWGMNISLRPFSRVNASSSLSEDVEDVGNVTREFAGSGGLNQVGMGHGFKFKNFYAGADLSYLFGQIQHERAILYNSIPLPFHVYSRDNFSFRGFVWNVGLQYDLDFSEGQGAEDVAARNALTIGLTLGTRSALTTLSDQFRATRGGAWTGLDDDVIDSNQEGVDTILLTNEIKENGKLPGSISLGVVWKSGEKWLLGANFSRTGWGSFDSNALEGEYDNTYQVGIGGEFTPDANSYRFYHHKIKYRAGLTFGTDPRLINGNQINEVTINTGVGLPIFLSRQISFINLGLEFVSRGGNVPISENTLRFKAGVTLNNNLWFYKRKYN